MLAFILHDFYYGEVADKLNLRSVAELIGKPFTFQNKDCRIMQVGHLRFTSSFYLVSMFVA